MSQINKLFSFSYKNVSYFLKSRRSAHNTLNAPHFNAADASATKLSETLNKLNFKISRYEEAVKTGVLSWEE